MLRRPKATLTTSKWSSGKGSFSASHTSVGSATPASSSRSRPVRSMASLMSVCTTCAAGADLAWRRPAPGRRCRRRCRAPCEPSPHVGHHHGVGLPGAMQARRHQVVHEVVARARPSRRRRARGVPCRFSSTDSKPKWVLLMQPMLGRKRSHASRRPRNDGGHSCFGSSMAAAGVAALFGHGRIAVDARSGQAPLVLGPQLVLPGAELVQQVPREDAGVVAVAEGRLHRVVADRLQVDAGRPRACRSAAPPGPGRGPAPRPTASRCASARTGCGRWRRRKSPPPARATGCAR